jgi:Mg2+ and Co2+ transporter CorA
MNNEIILTIFVQSIAFIAAFVKMFTDMKLKLKELEIRLYGVEKKDNEMSQKLEKIFASLNEIKLALKDKQDKL